MHFRRKKIYETTRSSVGKRIIQLAEAGGCARPTSVCLGSARRSEQPAHRQLPRTPLKADARPPGVGFYQRASRLAAGQSPAESAMTMAGRLQGETGGVSQNAAGVNAPDGVTIGSVAPNAPLCRNTPVFCPLGSGWFVSDGPVHLLKRGPDNFIYSQMLSKTRAQSEVYTMQKTAQENGPLRFAR